MNNAQLGMFIARYAEYMRHFPTTVHEFEQSEFLLFPFCDTRADYLHLGCGRREEQGPGRGSVDLTDVHYWSHPRCVALPSASASSLSPLVVLSRRALIYLADSSDLSRGSFHPFLNPTNDVQ